jgi:hypothetical protein
MVQTEYIWTADGEQRNEQFVAELADGRQLVHRLREWESGDTLWGYMVVGETAALGKTFRAGSEPPVPNADADTDAESVASRKANDGFEQHVGGDRLVFLYSAHIAAVETEPRGLADPREPPLTLADLTDIRVHETFVPDALEVDDAA